MARLFDHEADGCCRLEIAKDSRIYESGEPGATIYFIRKGRVELLLPGTTGPDFPLSVRSEGNIVGESCLSGRPTRLENAVALEDTILEEMPASTFLTGLRNDDLLEDFVRHLASFLVEERQIIDSLALRGSDAPRGSDPHSSGLRLDRLIQEDERA